jgi:hypothetical protein
VCVYIIYLTAQAGDTALILSGVELEAGFLFERFSQVRHQTFVEVLAAQMRVPVGRKYLEDSVIDREEGHVKGAACEVQDQDVYM